ncbi:iron complex transport system ATP-binding protein [Pustulibacterium marinum]|uniref:Iron complex transport system ATP-binding protein n=1 Tax=Pustulibacterium marinum TaxID=1224947 RepID=A0A1I7IDY6_9FLAO|nr:ABC transporter ATP-binding protein [Pustulibacterium marinum]SFU71132.1 iron complex transport system ATP-binding protein [Pustulibacterium marinum]
MEANEITMKATNLSIGYLHKKEKTTLAKNINFQLAKGNLIALVGPNGIGKSTLLKTICGTLKPLQGTINIQQKSIHTYDATALSKVLSIVFTESIPPSNLTVAEIIALGRQPYTNWIGTLSTADKAKVKEVLQLLRLESLATRKCTELSDGQLQKVLLGRALAQDTDIIVLDEPTTHLDVYHKAYIMKLLKEVAHTTQKTILFSTHEVTLAIQLCDQMMVLTADDFVIDQPCNLITEGSFAKLFPEDLIVFDAATGSFKVNT